MEPNQTPPQSDVAKPAEAAEQPQPKVVLHIRRVGTFDTGDGTLEIYARWSERKKSEAADNAGDSKNVTARIFKPAEPKPKKMPACRAPLEPPYPPSIGL